MDSRRRVLMFIVLGAVLLAGVAAAFAWPRGDATTAASDASPAPSIRLPLIDDEGRIWDLDTQRGTPVLVNFWASWCTPCRVEMPDIDDLVRRSEGRLTAVGVNVLDNRSQAAAFAQEIGVDYPLVVDRTGSIAQAYEVTGLPTTVVVDADGRIVGRATGRPNEDALEAFVTESLGPDWNHPAD